MAGGIASVQLEVRNQEYCVMFFFDVFVVSF